MKNIVSLSLALLCSAPLIAMDDMTTISGFLDLPSDRGPRWASATHGLRPSQTALALLSDKDSSSDDDSGVYRAIDETEQQQRDLELMRSMAKEKQAAIKGAPTAAQEFEVAAREDLIARSQAAECSSGSLTVAGGVGVVAQLPNLPLRSLPMERGQIAAVEEDHVRRMQTFDAELTKEAAKKADDSKPRTPLQELAEKSQEAIAHLQNLPEESQLIKDFARDLQERATQLKEAVANMKGDESDSADADTSQPTLSTEEKNLFDLMQHSNSMAALLRKASPFLTAWYKKPTSKDGLSGLARIADALTHKTDLFEILARRAGASEFNRTQSFSRLKNTVEVIEDTAAQGMDDTSGNILREDFDHPAFQFFSTLASVKMLTK